MFKLKKLNLKFKKYKLITKNFLNQKMTNNTQIDIQQLSRLTHVK